MSDHAPTRVEICLSINGRFDFFVHLIGLHEIAQAVGIRVTPGQPFPHQPPGENPVPKVSVSLAKKSAQRMRAAAPGAKAAGSEFVLLDNEDSSCTVQGIDAGGN